MSKSDKKMGIPKPKYDPEKAKERKYKAPKNKPFVLVIPEREPTEAELADEEAKKGSQRWWPDWFKPWTEKVLGKFPSEKSAQQSLDDAKKKKANDTCRDIWYRGQEYERAVIIDTRKKEDD